MWRHVLVALVLAGCAAPFPSTERIEHEIRIEESLGNAPAVTRGQGVLTVRVIAPSGDLLGERVALNAWPDSGEAFFVESWRGNQTLSSARFHGLGTSATAFAEAQTGCVSELSTHYGVDNTRATGTLDVGATPSVFRTVGTNTIDAPGITLREFCLMTNSIVGQGTGITRVLITPIATPSGSTVITTYEVTFE